MKIIATDGIGVRALVTVAEKIRDILDEHGVILGMGYADGEDVAVAIVKAKADDYDLAVTVETNPRLIDMDDHE